MMTYPTATNPQTGEKVVQMGGKWKPYSQSATNDQGIKAYNVDGQWVSEAEIAPESATPPKERGIFDMLSAPFEMGASLASKPRAEQAAFITPTIVALGTAGGALAGTAIGGPVGGLVGAGFGGAAAKELTRLLPGTAAPETMSQAAIRQAKSIAVSTVEEGMGRYVVAPAIHGLAKGAGWLKDLWTGNLVQVRGGKIMREIAGADLGVAKTLAAKADPGLTAAQATAGADSNMLASMGQRADRMDPTNFFSRTAASQEAARAADLARVTPDLAKSVAARTTISDPLYTAARASGPVDTSKAVTMINDMLAKNPGNTELVAALRRVQDGLYKNVPGSPNMPALRTDGGEVSSVLDGMKAIIANKDNRFVLKSLLAVKGELEQAIPGYQAAQKAFAGASPPVNQAQVLAEMSSVLAKPTGGERVTPFLNVLGRGETAMIKKSTGAPRYEAGDLSKILTPKQMGVVDDIAAQLKRDYALDQAATRGAGGLSRLLGESQMTKTPPPAFSALTRTTNFIIRILEGSVNAKSLVALENGMRSGKDFLKLVNTLPAAEQSAVLKVLGQTQRAAGGGLAGLGLTDAANALVTRHQNQNAMNE